ncbi:MAG: hypothetical protein NVV82_04455 [Sporocytophaga sp.]|nr:hypothetical protein [Sporocytophaga sp.]
MNKSRILKSGGLAIALLLSLFTLHSCGCKCDCIKGSECSKVSIYLNADGSLAFEKEYCQNYDRYDENELIKDSIDQLVKVYPDSEYKVVTKDTSYVESRIQTKQCEGNPPDYSCECAK